MQRFAASLVDGESFGDRKPVTCKSGVNCSDKGTDGKTCYAGNASNDKCYKGFCSGTKCVKGTTADLDMVVAGHGP